MNNIHKYQCIPQNDMDCYYNTTWRKMKEIHGSAQTINNFTILENKIDKEMYRFINGETYGQDSVLNNLVKFRDSYYNRNESYGPIIKLVDEIQNIANINDFSKMVLKLLRINVPTLFTLKVEPHFRKPDNYFVGIGDLPLTLEPNSMYRDMAEDKWIDYQNMIQAVNNFIQIYWGYRPSKNNMFVENISVLEFLFSKSTLTMDEARNPLFVLHSSTYQDFLYDFDVRNFWKNILDGLVDQNDYILYENIKILHFLKKFIADITDNELSMLKDYLIFCLAREYGIFTTPLLKEFGKVMFGKNEEKHFSLQLFYLTFGPYLQSIFESKYYDQAKINYAYDMFQKMKTYCTEIINQSDIFRGDTKIEANNKIKTLDMVIGVQKSDIMLSNLPPLESNFYQNLIIINSFYFNNMIKIVGKPVDRYNLSITNDLYSFMVNAYYEPFSNLIYLPTAMLDDMFLQTNRDPIYNYGSIGIIIAHEMMHCFDTYGAMFDHHGHLKNWWSKNDYQKYMNEILKVKNHYRTILLYDIPINSEASLSEDIADITGIKISFRTYLKNYLKNYLSNNQINYLTRIQKEYLKKFFETWTKTLREIEEPEFMEDEILFGVHSPNIVRVNAPFAHLDEYYKIYNVEPHHLNYLDPSLRTQFFNRMITDTFTNDK